MKWNKNKLSSSHILQNTSFEFEKSITRNQIKRRYLKKILKELKRWNIYVEIICALFIILFIYTGINKIIDHSKFKFEMGRSPFIQNISGFIAIFLPIGEILIALGLIIKPTRLLGLHLSFALMALFTGYIWIMLNYAYDLPCSCGGIISNLSWHDHLIFNSCFTMLAIIGVLLQTKIIHGKSNKIITPKKLSL